MIVYLLHFERPYKHARHYVGSTSDLARRLQEHASGIPDRASALMVALAQEGIPFRLARTWECDDRRNREFKLKKQGGHSRKCPLCGRGRADKTMQDAKGLRILAGDTVAVATTTGGKLAQLTGLVEVTTAEYVIVRPARGRRRRVTDSARIVRISQFGGNE